MVSILGCTGDWTGGWDCSTPEGTDRFITADLQRGRMVEVIERGEPAYMVCHWTGIFWNGQELGFKVFQEVVRRLHARFNHLLWMKLSEVARYWAARELTRFIPNTAGLDIYAPFACPNFTFQFPANASAAPRWQPGGKEIGLREVSQPTHLQAGTWCRQGDGLILCCDLPKGSSTMRWKG